jgi:hypothetical protein
MTGRPAQELATTEGNRYRLDRDLCRDRDAAVSLDNEAERLTERLQIALTSVRDRKAIVERRAKLWRAAALLRDLVA